MIPTPRQQSVLDTIALLTKTNQAAPTVRQIGKALGITSPNGVIVHLTALRKKGFVAPSKGKQHIGVRLMNPAHCPCCGQGIAK